MLQCLLIYAKLVCETNIETFIFMQHILYRQKEQFSDGVGYSWIDGLKAHAAKHVFESNLFTLQFSDGVFYCHKVYVTYNWFFTFSIRWLIGWCLMLAISTPTTPQTPRKHTTTEWSLRGSSLRQVNQSTLLNRL